jgi:hypothetical protein
MAAHEHQLELMALFQELAGILERHGVAPHVSACLRSYGDSLELADVMNFARVENVGLQSKGVGAPLQEQLLGLHRLLGQILEVIPTHRCPEGNVFFTVRHAEEKVRGAAFALDAALRMMKGEGKPA